MSTYCLGSLEDELTGAAMPQERVRCDRCLGSGKLYTAPFPQTCPKCSGYGYRDEYRMAPGPLRSFLRPIVALAMIGLIGAYVLNIAGKMPSHSAAPPTIDKAALENFYPIQPTDLPAACQQSADATGCSAAVEEVRSGQFGAKRCGYFDATTNKTKFYFFWRDEVPTHLVALVQGDAASPLRPLGRTAIHACPASSAEAQLLFTSNSGG